MSGDDRTSDYQIVRLDGKELTVEDIKWIKENILKFIPPYEVFESEPE